MIERKEIEKYALQNAVFHSGKAELGPVMGKILSVHPELKKNIQALKKEIEIVLKWVNNLGIEEQRKKLEEIDPSLLEKKTKKQEGLPELEGVEKGVVTRFAPSPTGPLSLGQFLRAVMLSYYYARKYEGKFILRIEDTDPSKIKKEYAEWIQEDLKKCGIDWDLLVYQSDRMDIYYEHAEKLLKLGRAYVCECPAEDFKKFKLKSFECPCRSLKIEEHLKRWGKMLRGGYEEGQAAVRLKTSMSNPNPVLRDPPILRINNQEHPMKGNKYFVWPLYNFSCAIDDHFLGVTHVFRGKEHVKR
jgi:glutamyl-tRNA synthetase